MDIIRSWTMQSVVKIMNLNYLINHKLITRKSVLIIILWIFYYNVIIKSFLSVLLSHLYLAQNICPKYFLKI